MFTCELCDAKIANKGNFYKHKKYLCPVKIEQEKIKILESQNQIKLYYENIIEKLKREHNKNIKELRNELKITQEKLDRQNNNFIAFMQENQKTSTTTLDKSVDALTFLMTHRKNAPELKKITQENAQELLTHENKLYDYLLHFNSENKLDQYIGDIILKYIKKENPEEQSVWNSDVSRLTFLIREIIDESPTWLRDPNGAMFNAKIITPVISEVKKYLDKCLYSKNPDKVKLDDDSEQSDSSSDEEEEENDIYAEKALMRRRGNILGTMETLRSKKFKKSLAEYIASHIPLHKIDKKVSKDNKTKNATKKKSDDSSDSEQDEKPRKIIRKKPIKKSDSSSDSEQDEKPRKIIRKKK